jgi:DNA-binding PadR family transcriptional regulator
MGHFHSNTGATSRLEVHCMGRHRGGRGFRGFHAGSDEAGGSGHGPGHAHGRIRSRKIGSDDLQLLLLLLLAERPSHGYELIRALEQRSAGFYVPSPGMIYPALTYLEELQQATVRVEGTRKQYEIAPAGRAHLEQHRSAAEAVMRQLELFGRRMAAFSGDAADAAPVPHRLSLGSAVDGVLAPLHDDATRGRGELIYLLCRSLHARRVVHFAASPGVSALYLAAAMRDNDGGTVISAGLVAEGIDAARRQLTAAGLESHVELHQDDARQTLRSVHEAVDFVAIDSGATGNGSSLALEVLQLVAVRIRSGGMVLHHNAAPACLAYVRDPANGFTSITLPLMGGTELSLKR